MENTFKPATNKNWTPPKTHHSVETYIEVTNNEIQEKITKIKPSNYSNLTKGEKKALDELKNRDDIIITNADKGGAVVILDVEDYINECNRQLNNNENYRFLANDPTTSNNETVNNTITRFRNENLIDKNVAEGLKAISPRTPQFYIQPKIHKEGTPGRPVISSVNCHTSKISKFVDYHLQPIVKEIPSYVKDTSDFLRKLNTIKTVPDNSYLVSLDVKSLYTSIPNSEGVKAVKKSFDEFPRKTVATKVITTFLALILTLNNFVFNCKNYLQTKGCAMGTICAPSYANIFMDHFVKKYIYPFLHGLSLIYLRFIDDIFFIWTGTKENLIEYLEELNQKHDSIKFEYKISKTKLTFLDTEIQIKDNKLITKFYRKPTDRQNFLHANSEHPKNLKNSIAYSQALRIKRICTTFQDFQHYCTELKQNFIKQGYDSKLLTEQFSKAKHKDRSELLKEKETTEQTPSRIPLVLTYSRFLPNISKIIKKHWDILSINQSLKEVFQNKPITAFKRNKNIKDMIGSKKIENNKVKKLRSHVKEGKCTPCLSNKRTLCCKQVQSTSNFKSQQTKKTYNIYHHVNCNTPWVIYLMECNLCNKQYIGKSETPFNIRLNNHRKDVKNHSKPDTILACKHFQTSNHDFNKHAKFTIIDKLINLNNTKENLRRKLIERENFWIEKLDTLFPKGLNQELTK